MTSNETSTEPLLVIMAAGLGSRFGGVKQLARVGPKGETFLDLSIVDAKSAGFGRVVMIVRSDIESDVAEQLNAQHDDLDVVYALQDELGPPREKPWGTLHAVLSAADLLDRPFAVLNADDYYGPATFKLGAECIAGLAPGRAGNIAFEMGNTLPPSGSVTRGVTAVEDGKLTEIVETEDCERLVSGELSAGGKIVAPDTPVSMNFWCFHDSILDDFSERWDGFLAANRDQPKAEAQLPTIVGELVDQNRLVVDVVSSPERWIGITNPEDFELAKEALRVRA